MMTNNIYDRIYSQLKSLFTPETTVISKMATIVALLHFKCPDYFWTGFYLLQDGELTVGPYQGPLACIKLEKNRGVCWHSVNSKTTVIVPDVDKFPGHIACSSLSKSEIVIPVLDVKGEIFAVLDVDSKLYNRFSDVDKNGLEKIIGLI